MRKTRGESSKYGLPMIEMDWKDIRAIVMKIEEP